MIPASHGLGSLVGSMSARRDADKELRRALANLRAAAEGRPLPFSPSPESDAQRESRWRREAQAEVDALTPALADYRPPAPRVAWWAWTRHREWVVTLLVAPIFLLWSWRDR